MSFLVNDYQNKNNFHNMIMYYSQVFFLQILKSNLTSTKNKHNS